MIRTIVARAAVALLGTAALTLVAPATPAQAAYCSGDGVSVLVDFGGLDGGRTATGCGHGGKADAAFGDAGFALTYSQRLNGFVCQVAGKPEAGKPCTDTDAYWAFFVSDDGKGWVYASVGVPDQTVDSGDSVALVWQSTSTRRVPGQRPAAAAAPSSSPRPTKAAAPVPTKVPAKRATTKAAAPGVTPTPTTSGSAETPTGRPTAKPTRKPSTKPAAPTLTATPTVAPTAAPTASATTDGQVAEAQTEPAAATDDGGLPGWVPPVIIVLLVAAAGGVAWVRKARSTP